MHVVKVGRGEWVKQELSVSEHRCLLFKAEEGCVTAVPLSEGRSLLSHSPPPVYQSLLFPKCACALLWDCCPLEPVLLLRVRCISEIRWGIQVCIGCAHTHTHGHTQKMKPRAKRPASVTNLQVAELSVLLSAVCPSRMRHQNWLPDVQDPVPKKNVRTLVQISSQLQQNVKPRDQEWDLLSLGPVRWPGHAPAWRRRWLAADPESEFGPSISEAAGFRGRSSRGNRQVPRLGKTRQCILDLLFRESCVENSWCHQKENQQLVVVVPGESPSCSPRGRGGTELEEPGVLQPVAPSPTRPGGGSRRRPGWLSPSPAASGGCWTLWKAKVAFWFGFVRAAHYLYFPHSNLVMGLYLWNYFKVCQQRTWLTFLFVRIFYGYIGF